MICVVTEKNEEKKRTRKEKKGKRRKERESKRGNQSVRYDISYTKRDEIKEEEHKKKNLHQDQN